MERRGFLSAAGAVALAAVSGPALAARKARHHVRTITDGIRMRDYAVRIGGTTPPPPAGEVLWSGDMSSITLGTVVDVPSASTVFLPTAWPYSSIQAAGNTTSANGYVEVSNFTRNAKEAHSLKVVMEPNSQRVQPSSDYSWTTDSVGSTDLWYGWSMYYDTDWGNDTTLANEMTGTYWHNPIAFRWSGANGMMNLSGDDSDNNSASPAQGTVTSTPRTMYLRRNSVRVSEFNTQDGQGLDKINLGQVTTGVWMDFIIHVRWSSGTNALRECWRDGVFMGSRTTVNSLDDTGTHVLRTGIYQETNINHYRTAYFSNVRIGTTKDIVDPSIV